MDNFYELIRDGLHYNKFTLDELLCVEYTCPLPDEESVLWAQTDYIIHVLSGKKTWRTLDEELVVYPGDTIYIKKGVAFIRQFFDDDFCVLVFFVSDSFIRKTLLELEGKLPLRLTSEEQSFNITRINETPVLKAYFQSMLHYFGTPQKPVNSVLELKFKELIIDILVGNSNQSLARYFFDLGKQALPSLREIMEQNYCYNLSLEQFAKLCHRSLSSFQRDFQTQFQTTPGKWLLSKRLERAAYLLHRDSTNIAQIAYMCGFEHTSHFSRTFKEKFGVTPLAFRNQLMELG